ncbi:hypothetical protein MMYC01_210046 [Madurella mycetomatis]|uniref:Kanamycin B dioxygenase n=1 Tax=Madurella mycetomatis TaxID=100816 RepID=A0A175VPS8_9PEZI|nr:hypothetical protein MMYC01_210046 [Madurella mycetomatis]
MTDGDSHPHLTSLRREGYVIIPSILSAQELSTLRDAASRLTQIARTGAWPHIRTVGKQFPPWDASLVPSQTGIWGVQHLLHPSLPVPQADRDAFARLYFSPRLLAVTKELLSLPAEGSVGDACLVMELLNMLVRPDGDGGFALRWHRDDIPPSATPEEEAERLSVREGEDTAKVNMHTQWNLPLFDDESLIVVPRSHRRARTRVEREADPYEEELPGMVRVKLRAGDVAFYDNNILHRGVYEAGKERMTLHGSVGHVKGSRQRVRNVLQHGVGEWVDRCDFTGLGEGPEREAAEGMRRRLVELGRENQGKDVGYSLDG